MITILEEWTVINLWWTGKPKENNFVVVNWDNQTLVFKQALPDKVWRIVRGD